MAEEITGIKISTLHVETNLEGLYTLGVNAQNQSVKVSLEFVGEAAQNANNAASSANEGETTRQANETARQSNELSRQQAEEEREQDVSALINSATTAVNEKIDEANAAISGAEESATNADEKAALANEKAILANEKAALAQEKADAAESARQAIITTEGEIEAAESSRVTAEAVRVTTFNNQMNESDEKIEELQGYNARLISVENKLQMIYPYGQVLYGVERTRGSADPSFPTVIGNTDQHTKLPLHGLIRACKAGEDRKIVNYLNQTNWNYNEDGTPSVLDGTDGLEVFLDYPHIWAILGGASETYERWIISDGPFTYDGEAAIEINRYIDSPDYCTVNRTNNRLMSVRNDADTNLAGSGAGTTAGGLGYPRTALQRYTYELYAANKGDKWKNWYYRDLLVLSAFMYIEYKTKNLKSAFGTIGTGWTSANWTTYNTQNPVRKIFETQLGLSGTSEIVAKGHMTGTWTKSFSFDDGTGTMITYDTPFGVYRGKVLWGDLWKYMSGIDLEIQADDAGAESRVYVTYDPDLIDANRSDTNFSFKDTYELLGLAPRANTWVNRVLPHSVQANTAGGAETTYDCQYFWHTSPDSGATIRRALRFGASLTNGSSCALASASSYYAPSLSNSSLGCGCRADVDG